MLITVPIRQFGGLNTVLDSSQAGTSMARTAKNFMLRPIGGLGLPPAWTPFSCGGTALDLGFVNTFTYLFDGGRLLLQSPNGSWWDCSLVAPGVPNNVTVATPSSTLSANLVLTSGQTLAFKISDSSFYQMIADDFSDNYAVISHGSVPYYTTRYTADRAFTTGYGPVIPDGRGNDWKLQADDETGLYAITI